jgi:hypothetical protein
MASKMFKASPRQREILAAMEKPENLELVQQLDEYLDEEFVVMKNQAEQQSKQNLLNQGMDNPNGIDGPMDDTSSPSVPHGSPARFSPNESLMDKHGDELADEESEFDIPIEDEPDTSSDEPVASTKATKEAKSIKADTIVNPFVDLYASLNGIANEIKGTLNVRQDTTGVNRVQIKNDELWIYYNDDINLNNVMANVIGVLNSANYKYFEFNRLARTDNAIVFTVSLENSDMVTGVSNNGEK